MTNSITEIKINIINYNLKILNMKWYLKCLHQYADFSGRARRREYWTFVLINLIISILIIGFENIIGMAIPEIGYGPLTPLYSLFVLIPSLAVVVRRLHDVGKSGWMFLILLIPIVGFIGILVLLLTDSQQESNNWGDNPKLEEWI